MAERAPKARAAEPRPGGAAPPKQTQPASAEPRLDLGTGPEWARQVGFGMGPRLAGLAGGAAGDDAAGPFGVLVDDPAPPGPGQMARGAFMARLEERVRAAADAELAQVGKTARDCPYLEAWLAFYRTKPAGHVERAIRHYTSDAHPSVEGLAAGVEARVRLAVARWRETGQLSGIPEQSPFLAPAEVGGGPLLRAAAPDAPASAADPAATAARLGPGQPLDAGVRARMERGLGGGLGQVRVHADPTAAELARQNDALAFTVGEHVAFAEGAYRPGTVVGDALLAHELAHARQQRGATAGTARAGAGALERDADRAAAGALGRLWAGVSGAPAGPGGRTGGLALQRCSRPDPLKAGQVTAPPITSEDESFLEDLEGSESLELKYEEYVNEQNLATSSLQLQGMTMGQASPSTYDRATAALHRFRVESTESGETTGTDAWAALESWKAKKASFEAIFEKAAVAEAYGELERNEKLVQGELDRYGTAAGLDALRAALKPHQAALEKVRDERAAGAPVKKTVKGGVYVMVDPPDAEKHRAAAKSLADPVRKALVGTFPVVAAEDLQLERVLLEPPATAQSYLTGLSSARIDDIQKTRGAIADKPSRVWQFDRAVELARKRLMVEEGSVFDLMIKDRYARVEREEFFRNILVGALAIGLGLLSAGTGTVAVLAAVGGATISGVTAATHLRDYLIAQAATGTAFDKAQAISSEEPSLFWLALDVVVAFADLGMAARAFRSLKGVAAGVKTAEDAEKLRAPAKSLAQAEKLTEPEANAAADAVVSQAKQHVAAEQAIKVAEAADPLAVAAIRAVVKDEGAVSGLLKLQASVRTTLLGAFKQGALTKLGRLIEEYPQMARSIEGLAAKLPKDQFEWVMEKFLFRGGALRTGQAERATMLLRAAADAGLDAGDYQLIADALKTTGTQKQVAKKIGGLLLERIAEKIPGGAGGIKQVRELAKGLSVAQSGRLFERWAVRNIYAGAKRFGAATSKLMEEFKAAKPSFQGDKIEVDHVLRDTAKPGEAGIGEVKSHFTAKNLASDADAVKQAENYAEMIRVGVKTADGEKFTWVEYLFANEDAAKASYKFLKDKLGDAVKVFVVDEQGAKKLFVPAGP